MEKSARLRNLLIAVIFVGFSGALRNRPSQSATSRNEVKGWRRVFLLLKGKEQARSAINRLLCRRHLNKTLLCPIPCKKIEYNIAIQTKLDFSRWGQATLTEHSWKIQFGRGGNFAWQNRRSRYLRTVKFLLSSFSIRSVGKFRPKSKFGVR